MRNTIQNLSYPYLMLILIIHLPFTRMETIVHGRPYHPPISLTPTLVLDSPTSFSFFNGRKSTWCHPHAFPASAEAKGCTPIPSRPLGQPHDRHPIYQIDVSRERKPLARLQGLQQPAPRCHRDAAAGRVQRRGEQDDAAAWREAPAVRTSFEGPQRSLSYPVPPSPSPSPEVERDVCLMVQREMRVWTWA